MARLVAITGPMDDAKTAAIIAALDPILKEQVASERMCNQALAGDLAACKARIDLIEEIAQERREMDGNTIYRLVDRVVAVQNKLDAANARLKDLGAAVIE